VIIITTINTRSGSSSILRSSDCSFRIMVLDAAVVGGVGADS